MPPKAKKGKKRGTQSQEENNSARAIGDDLLEMINSGAAISTGVDLVLNNYANDDPNEAIAAVVSMVCRSCGVTGEGVIVDGASVVEHNAIAGILEEVFAGVKPESAAYLLVNKDAKYRRFRKAFPDFFETLVASAAQRDLLHDGTLLDRLSPWLFAMSESKARSFRHTATVAVYSMITGLCEHVASTQEAVGTKSKKRAGATQSRVEATLQLIDELFSATAATRFKDVAPEIRLLTIQSLRSWMLTCPQHFLVNERLRFIGFALHDKKPEVRLEALEAITQLLHEQRDQADRMSQFLVRFCERITHMASDVDSRVAEMAIKTSAVITDQDVHRGVMDEGGSVISPDKIDSILFSVFDDRHALRHACGKMLQVLVRARGKENAAHKAKIVCDFAMTMRKNFECGMAEAYVVDSLWVDAKPPAVLTEFKPLVNIVNNKKDLPSSITALRILGALLARMGGNLELGPVPKDDLKVTLPKEKKEKKEDAADLAMRVSKELAGCIGDFLEANAENDEVVESVATVLVHMDLAAFSTQRLTSRYQELLTVLRKATLTATSEPAITALGKAWHKMAFSEYPLRTEVQVHLDDVVKGVLKQLNALEKKVKGSPARNSQGDSESSVAVWQRAAFCSALTPMQDQWGIFKTALIQHSSSSSQSQSGASSQADKLRHVVQACVTSVIWKLAGAQDDPSLDPSTISKPISDVMPVFIKIMQRDSDVSKEELRLRAHTATCALDLAALEMCNLSQAEEEAIIEAFIDIFEQCAVQTSEAERELRENVRLGTTGDVSSALQSVLDSRSGLTTWEALSCRLAKGILRLFASKNLPAPKAARVLLLWTKTPTKAAADVFKCLFHVLRGSTTDIATVERTMLAAAFRQCLDLGESPLALESFYAIGSKLASMHFMADKFYNVVPAVVRECIDLASEDPTANGTMLHGVAPYCSKLHQADAARLAAVVAANEELSSSMAPHAVRAFISALRRAAKLEDAKGPRGTTGSMFATPGPRARRSVAAKSTEKRARDDRDDLMNDIVKGRVSKARAPAKETTAGGWRARAGEPSATPQQEPPKVSQVSNLSSLMAEAEEEAFITTQDWS